MSDLDALYRAVLDRPDDDTPRLVYADALDDLGDAARAAFVRGQVEAARAAPWEPDAVRAQFLRGYPPPGTAWLSDLPELPPGLDWALPPFRRGFPALVQADDGAAFVAAADRLFDLAPIESLELAAARASDIAALASCRGLARLKRLVIREGLGQAFAQRLLNSDHLAALEELVIGAGLTSARTAAAVVRSTAFRRLRAFSYRDDPPGGAMVAALARLADPPPLRALDLRGNRMTVEGLSHLLPAPVVLGLESLDVGDNHLGADGFPGYPEDVLPNLRRLDVMAAGLGGSGFARLDATPVMRRLRFLNLGGNALAPAAMGTAWAASLRRIDGVLDLRDNRLGDAGVAELVRLPCPGLLHLDLAENGVGAAGAEALIAAPGLDRLIALDLGGNPLPAAVRAALRDRFGSAVLL